MAPNTLLDEIRLMARADHAYRLPSDANPYAPGDPRAAAWSEGWHAEDDRVHGLDEEIVKLPQFRVTIEIVAGSDVLAPIDRDQLAQYRVSNLRSIDARAVSYESAEARSRFPDRDGVIIRVTYDGAGGMFD
ncbi:MAG: hypothetical protein JWL96_4014 [Sphingomonas bacterium]|jgi:hypothetical protein|nr:hypothetical protein [Sphingomonas bacterium]